MRASIHDVFSKDRRQLAHRARPGLGASRSGERPSVAESQTLTLISTRVAHTAGITEHRVDGVRLAVERLSAEYVMRQVNTDRLWAEAVRDNARTVCLQRLEEVPVGRARWRRRSTLRSRETRGAVQKGASPCRTPHPRPYPHTRLSRAST